jgi:hypothetical protein
MGNCRISPLVAALLAAFFAVSCASGPKAPPPVYGEPGPDTVCVSIGGNSVQAGIYYFKNGTTLDEALRISGDMDRNKFETRVVLYNCETNPQKGKAFHFRKLSASEAAEVLHSGDRLFFSCEAP